MSRRTTPRMCDAPLTRTTTRVVVDGPAAARASYRQLLDPVFGQLMHVPSDAHVFEAMLFGTGDADRLFRTRNAFLIRLRTLSVEDECEHGRLVGDRTPDCGCFTTLPLPTPDLMGDLARAEKEIHMPIETPVVPIASQVDEYMRSCDRKVSPADVGAALELTGEQVGHHLKRMTLAGTLKAEGQTRGRRYWNPDSYVEPEHTPEPEPIEAPPIATPDPIEAAPKPEPTIEAHAIEDCPIGVAVDALTQRLLTMDAGRDELKAQIAALEVQLGESNDARARLVQAIHGLENLDQPVLAAA